MGITPLTLSGVSQYSTDYQNVLNRAVQIAEIPIQQLQNQDSDLLQQKTLLGSLNTAAGSLLSSLKSLSTLSANQAVSASSSNTTVLMAAATGAAILGSYTIDSITSVASAASERSVQSYADSASTPVSSTGVVQWNVGSQNYTLNLTNNSLIGLRDAINASGAAVTASILTTSNGNYLSLSANATGHAALHLIDDPITPSNPNGANTELLTQTNPGTSAEFSLNGIDIVQASNTVNAVIPGVTLQLRQKTNTPITVSLQSDPTALSSGLQDFVENYNSLRLELQAQQGPSAGLLSGNIVVSQLQQTLRQLTNFSGSGGTIKSLGELGISFDSTGKATFDQNAFSSLSSTQISDGFGFLKSLATGAGNFSGRLQMFTDPVAGMIQAETEGIGATDQHIQSQIAVLADRISRMQSNLQLQLAKADALEAALQSQQSTINASLLGLNYVLYGKNVNG